MVNIIVNDRKFTAEEGELLYNFLKKNKLIEDNNKWVVIILNGNLYSIDEVKDLKIDKDLNIEIANIVGGG